MLNTQNNHREIWLSIDRKDWRSIPLTEAAQRVLDREAAKGSLTDGMRKDVAQVEYQRWATIGFDDRAEDDPKRVAFWQAFDFALELAVRSDLGARKSEIRKQIEAQVNIALDRFERVNGRRMSDVDRSGYNALIAHAELDRFVRVDTEVLQPVFNEAGVDRKTWFCAIREDPARNHPKKDLIRHAVANGLCNAFAGFDRHIWAAHC